MSPKLDLQHDENVIRPVGRSNKSEASRRARVSCDRHCTVVSANRGCEDSGGPGYSLRVGALLAMDRNELVCLVGRIRRGLGTVRFMHDIEGRFADKLIRDKMPRASQTGADRQMEEVDVQCQILMMSR